MKVKFRTAIPGIYMSTFQAFSIKYIIFVW